MKTQSSPTIGNLKMPSAKRPGGFALISTLLIVAAVTLLCAALFTMMRYEVATSTAYERDFRLELAVESGLNTTVNQIAEFLRKEEVGGAAFTTWAYNGNPTQSGYHVALTSGRPLLTNPTTPYLNKDNTIWPGIASNPGEIATKNPDSIWTDLASKSTFVVDLNDKGKILPDGGPLPAYWQDIPTTDGFNSRTAVWVDDESARIDLSLAGSEDRLAGESATEIPILYKGSKGPPETERANWVTEKTARNFIVNYQEANPPPPDTLKVTPADDFISTTHNKNYNVIQWAPALGPSEIVEPGRAYRGNKRMNLNWKGHIDPEIPVDERVEKIAKWIRTGVPEFYKFGAPVFWPASSNTQAPDYSKSLVDIPMLKFVRDNQISTIAASIIDYVDPDSIPTQPEWLAEEMVHLPPPDPPNTLFLNEYDLPEYFGADRAPRINEIQICWNSRGSQDNYEAKTNVDRVIVTRNGKTAYRYTIPVTFRFELWNMDKLPIPSAAYAIRSFFIQQITPLSMVDGEDPIPENSEPVFFLNSGNGIPFAPNEFKTFEFTYPYTRDFKYDRGTTWKAFNEGIEPPPGVKDVDNEPDGHQRSAFVLCDPDTGKWYHATCYKECREDIPDGVISAGLGNKGDSHGNKINDPRMEPLRMYALDTTLGIPLINFAAERDGSSNAGSNAETPIGTMGLINNRLKGSDLFKYQNLEMWMDRPKLNLSVPTNYELLEGVSRIGNFLVPPGQTSPIEINRYLSVGELGRIFDPGWTHPLGRGGTNTSTNTRAFHQGSRSPFRGGGTLRIGQNDTLKNLAQNSWNLVDLFDTVKGSWSELDDDEFIEYETTGKVNINVLKKSGTKSNIDTVFDLPSLFDGAPSDRAKSVVTNRLMDRIENRLKKGGTMGVPAKINNWQQARPFYSAAEMSELPTWEEPPFYFGINAAAVAVQPAAINRGDAGREEAFARASSLITTYSHCYRITVVGSIGKTLSSGIYKEVARRTRQYVVLFKPQFDPDSGALVSLSHEILYQTEL